MVIQGNPRNEARKIAETKRTILALAAEIDRVHAKAGEMPADEEELVRLLRKPMPTTAWGDPIKYRRHSEDGDYELTTVTEGFAFMIYLYYSFEPNMGVQRFPF